MAYTLQQTINWSSAYIQYSPLTAGLGQEPAVTIASMIRNSFASAPQTWPWNRAEVTQAVTSANQDYTIALPDFGFLEKASLTDANGKIFELKEIQNSTALSLVSAQQRPNTTISILIWIPGTSIKVRLGTTPDAAYTLNLTYQKAATSMGPFFVSAASTPIGGNTPYTGVFNPLSFPVGSIANITGFITTPANNGSFTVVSVTPTTLTVANPNGVAEARATYATNFDWSPIPDQYSDVYNNLFLSEALAMVDDNRAELYRRRGVGAFLAKAEGLTEMQKNAFVQQWLARTGEGMSHSLRTQQGVAARGV